MTKEEIIDIVMQIGMCDRPEDDSPALKMFISFAKLIAEKECERIKKQNAPEIEKTNAYIKQLELEKMESDILHNEHLKLLGEIKAMTEAARSAERKECAKFFTENDTNLFWGSQVASLIRARGQE